MADSRQCWGRTPTFKRCGRRQQGRFCHHHRHQLVAAPIAALTLLGLLAGLFQDALKPLFLPETDTASTLPHQPSLTIGGKHFLESSVLLEMMAIAIERGTSPRIEVTRRHNFRETIYCKDALVSGELDIYAEYTGTILTNHLGMDVSQSRGERNRLRHKRQFIQQALDRSPRMLADLTWLGDFGMHNGYALVMRRDRIEELGLDPSTVSISDLGGAGNGSFDIAGNPEAFERDDCLKAVLASYETLRFENMLEESEHHMIYELLLEPDNRVTDEARDAVDVVVGFTTDTQLLRDEFVPLRDDRSVFIHYFAGPLVRTDTLKRFEQNGLGAALRSLVGFFMRDGEDRYEDTDGIAARMRELLLKVEGEKDSSGKQLITPRSLERNPAAAMALERIVGDWMRDHGLLPH